MGNCHQPELSDTSSTFSKMKLEFIMPIGRGSFGKVWKASYKKKSQTLAVKIYNKKQIPSREALASILSERYILSKLSNPFIINMHFALQDIQNLYLGLDLKLGGDLRFHMLTRSFNEDETRFIMACLVLALEYIHSRNIIHKDLKPENIIFDEMGYVFLTDFGIASVMTENNYNDNAGTPGYMAPEVICRQKHSFSSDFFGLGVILYEIIKGTRPYLGKNRKEIREKIFEKQAKIDKSNRPEGWSVESVDFCNKLLKRKPNGRLGSSSISEVKNHRFFSSISFDQVKEFLYKPSFVPPKENNFCSEQVNFDQVVKVKETLHQRDFSSYFFIAKSNS